MAMLGCSAKLFFKRYIPHQTLHSFPTRRSSDLHFQAVVGVGLQGELVLARGVGGHLATGKYQFPRSEEHTSELQSRRDLVCRLLLEKKNFLKHILTHYSSRHIK